MKTQKPSTPASWPDNATENTRISNRSDSSQGPSLRVLFVNWLRALFGK